MIFQDLKQHPRLFLSILLLPLLFHTAIQQFSVFKESWIPGVPLRVCLLGIGIIWGGAASLLAAAMTFLLFKLFPRWNYIRQESAMYTICFLIPLCYMTLLGACMANDGPIRPSFIIEIQRGLCGLLYCGLIGGAMGIIAFAVTQLPGFRSRYSFPIALLLYIAASYVEIGWQIPALQALPRVPVEIAIYPEVAKFLCLIMNISWWWMVLLICWTILSWFKKLKRKSSYQGSGSSFIG